MILKGKDNVFEQIVSNYKKLILAGAIKNGEFLPSCRELAKELGVNPNTVSKAYTVLESEGFVTAVFKKGVYVSYGEEKQDNFDDLKKHLNVLKNEGYSKADIEKALKEVFEGDK
ncbi:MAG: GntR family transcriptional regulator [Acholeplasmatales bacterium]|nr:GntR family transcriptional regulator [Acholeplasmatales bacterium]